MRKIWSVLFAIIVFSPAISATAIEPDFKDIYLPIIQSISISHEVSVTSDSSGKKQYPVVFKVDLNVKVHRNSLAGFGIRYIGPVSTTLNLCQSISDQAPNWNGIWISIGNIRSAGGEGDLKTIPGLKSRTQSEDWFLESYQLEIPLQSNINFFPCQGKNTVDSIILRDVAGRFKQFVTRVDGSPSPLKENQPDSFETNLILSQQPESGCPKVMGGVWSGLPTRCIDKFQPASLSVSFSEKDKIAAELRADKAAADAKAAADKAAADKAAADLKLKEEAQAAADKLIADAKIAAAKILAAAKANAAATAKKTTITCIKGKLTKKVTAVNPKCPSGYKVKK